MPKEIFNREYEFLGRDLLLTFEEITRVARLLVDRGVEKIRLTGGEPLLRIEIEKLVEMLAGLGDIDLTITTNGSLLERKAETLAAAGLSRVTVSLDSLDDAVFRAMNDVEFPVGKVLDGIEAASAAGLGPVKVNAVVKRGVNDHTLVEMAEHFRGSGHILRFIEYMDVGATNGWRLEDVVPAAEIVKIVAAVLPCDPVDPNYQGEVARRYRYRDGSGEFGVIASVTQPFCGACTRLRLSAEGSLYTCLFATQGHDLRELVRAGTSDDDLGAFLDDVWTARQDRYSEIRSSETRDLPRVEMSYIGG
jgi:cyclic pyranopterin phosphate synthase